MRTLYFNGTDGRFVDADGTTIEQVGDWRIRSDQAVQSTRRPIGGNRPSLVYGGPELNLEVDDGCASETFEGTLQLATGAVQVRLTVVPELDGHINAVEPDPANRALLAEIHSQA